MMTSWLLQLLPLALTSLIPFVAFPMMGLMTPEQMAKNVFVEFMLTLMSGFLLAQITQKSGLHRRIAIKLVIVMGAKPHLVVLGLMAPTALLSLWIANLPVTIMMVSIANEVLAQLRCQALREIQQRYTSQDQSANSKMNMAESETSGRNLVYSEDHNLSEVTMIDPTTSDHADDQGFCNRNIKNDLDLLDAYLKNLKACFLFAISYSSTIGGAATLTGYPPNLLVKHLTDRIWQRHGFSLSPINFASWLIFNAPIQIIALFGTWTWLCLHFLVLGGCSMSKDARRFGVRDTSVVVFALRRQYNKLGCMTYQQYAVISLVLIQTCLWFFMEMDFMPGWGSFFPSGYMTMTVPSCMVILLTMLVPRELNYCHPKNKQTSKSLGDFNEVMKVFPWDLMIFVGGGMTLSEAMQISGLTPWIISQLSFLHVLSPLILMFVLLILVTAITELIANIVALNIFVPIAAQLAESRGMNPLYLVFPVALAASYSFVLPMASMSSAWILTKGGACVKDSIRVGPVVNLMCILLTLLAAHTWGMVYFDLDTIPWAINATKIVNNTDFT